jgi:TfoX/Sxy family transcriptional regulator of competence genes
MKIPRPDPVSIDLFKSLVPDDPQVTIKPMFGNISAFVNGNMFFGLFGNDLFVRLSSADQQELLGKKGASNLEPMKGRPMKDYVIMPRAWKEDSEMIRAWVSRSLAWGSKLPKKAGKTKSAKIVQNKP